MANLHCKASYQTPIQIQNSKLAQDRKKYNEKHDWDLKWNYLLTFTLSLSFSQLNSNIRYSASPRFSVHLYSQDFKSKFPLSDKVIKHSGALISKWYR
jgi:hypothetical protein